MSKKYWDKKTDTTEKKDSWQEPYSRETSVSAKAIQAIDTLLGFSGSWIGALSATAYTSTENFGNGDSPNSNPQWRVSNLGRFGYPELNFIPYNYRTNAMGSKGGSLVGHPISFSIVGPTVKSNGGSGGTHYWLIGNPTRITLSSTTHSLTDLYGDLSTLVDEGLYFVISETGAERGGKVFVTDSLVPREEYGQSAKFEVFRVTSVDNALGHIEFDKPIYKFFETGAKPQFEGLTFFVPYATRLAAIPDSGSKGSEKKFLVISPEHSAYNDLNPVANDASFSPFSKRGFAGQKGHALPIPIPVKNLTGRLEKGAAKADGHGVWRLTDLPTGHGLSGGEIIHITHVDAQLVDLSPTGYSRNNLLGWFEVIENDGATGLILARNVEINANTGEIYYGEDLFVNNATEPAQTIKVEFSVHDPVSTVFEGDYNADKIDSVRLTNLIDPNWVERTTKRVADDAEGTLFGGAPARADRSIFTTNKDGTTNANAGNLLDLGFRMVLFPAKEVSGNAVPDYTKPITSNEVIIDPSKTEKQTIHVDYSSGTVTLSHAPVSGGQIAPNGVVGVSGNNPRGEIVLFACCVPYSMEQGQTGAGVAITGGDLRGADHGVEKISYASSLGQITTAQIIQDLGAGSYIVKASQKIPKTAYFGLADQDVVLPTVGGWSLRPHQINSDILTEGVYKNIQFLQTDETSNGLFYIYQIDTIYTATTVSMFNRILLIAKQNLEFVPIQEDNSYGSAFRSDNVRFAFADIEANPDGSVTVFPTATKGPSQELRSQFPLGGSLDWGRVAFDSGSQRWKVSSPTHKSPIENQIGFEVLRGKTFLSDSISETFDFQEVVVGLSSIAPNMSGSSFSDTYDVTMEALPMNAFGAIQTPLHGLVFAESIVTKDLTWSAETGDRFVLALRPFSGTKEGWEGVNPTHWLSVIVPPNPTLANIVADINTGANELGFGTIAKELAGTTNEGRIIVTERSVEVMPTKHYLRSRPINAGNPISFDEDSRMIITVRSMHQKHPDRWLTFAITTSALTFSDHRELAAYLNRQLYNTEFLAADDLDRYIGHQIETAGFYAEALTSSPNPYLSGTTSYPNAPILNPTLQNREYPLLFIGDDDIRHPAFGDPTHPDAEKLILMLSGYGVGSGELIKIAPVGSPSLPCHKGIRSLIYNPVSNTLLESNVFNTVLVEVSEDFGKLGQNMVLALQGDFGSFVRICNAFHNVLAGNVQTSSDSVTQAFGKINGSVVDTISVAMKGASYFTFSESGTLSSARLLGTSSLSSFTPTTVTLKKNGLSLENTPSVHESKYHTEGNRDLSRWVEHVRSVISADLTDPLSGGWYRSWMSFTNRIVEAYEFRYPLSILDKGSLPLLHIFTDSRTRPTSDTFGLQSYFFKGENATGSVEGIFLDSRTAIMRLLDTSQNIPFDDSDISPIFSVQFEAKPRTTGFFGSHKATLSLLQNNNSARYGAPNDNSDLPNATYMAGGHIDLFSSDGARTNPSGITLGTALPTSGTDRIFMTHMEHGLFPTFYTKHEQPKNLDKVGGDVVEFAVTEHLEALEGGVSGIRFSGDTTLWFTNARPLRSQTPSANIFPRSLLGGAWANFDNHYGSSDLEASALFIDLLSSSYNFLFGGAHTPELIKGSTFGNSMHLTEGLVVLGLTQANLDYWNSFTGGVKLSDDLYGERFFEQNFLGDVRLAASLQGKYLSLSLISPENPPFTHASNEGVWRITHAPIIFDATHRPNDQFAGVVALRVERYSLPHQYFDATKVGQDDKGYAWGIYADALATEPICIADVVETGGIPTNVPSSVNGISIDPQGLGKSHFPMTLLRGNISVGESKLLQVVPHANSWGYPKTTAFFSTTEAGASNLGNSLKGIVRSWNSASMLEDLGEGKGYFGVDTEGKTKFSYKKRMGLGVVIDGGLGVVHATGFRSVPRPSLYTTFGGLASFGGSFPLTSTSVKTPIKVSNIFDTSEFIDDVYVVSPKGSLIFEDARALGGLGKRLQENLAVNHFLGNTTNTPNDALFPYNMGGVVFKGSGSVRYARGYNPLSASPSELSGYLGKSNSNGTKGMAIPNYGGCFLLPKGPPTTKGVERSNFRDEPFMEDGVPTDTPLYTFVQGQNRAKLTGATSVGNGSIQISSVHTNNFTLGTPTVLSGAGGGHEADHGGVLQGTSVPRSRKFAPYSNNQTIHLMEGMVVENVTNGTFYTVGEIGRIYDGAPAVGKDQLSLFSSGEMVGGDRPITQGSRILSFNALGEEVYFDLNPYVGYEGTYVDFAHGFGDRTDKITCGADIAKLADPASVVNLGERPFVRSLNVGNSMRITPNVEFVPIMGEFGVDGGLLPPYVFNGVTLKWGQVDNADALFYSMEHDFKKANTVNGAGDIGKFLYIAGTDCYQYTGWWVIVDVIENHPVQAPRTTGFFPTVTRDVAVVRKWKRGEQREGEDFTNNGALPMQPRSPRLRIMGNNHFGFLTGATAGNWFDPSNCSDLTLVWQNGDGTTSYTLTVPSAFFVGKDLKTIVTDLNADILYNGAITFGEINSIRWEFDGSHLNGVGGGDYTEMAAIEISLVYKPAFLASTVNYPYTYKVLTEFGSTMHGFFCSNTALTSNNATKANPTVETLGQVGIFSFIGVNSATDIGWGDRNNAALMEGDIGFMTHSAAKGLRWVFSHPLTEESVGSYLHLKKPQTKFFDWDVAGFVKPTDRAGGVPTWVSRYPTERDLALATHKKIYKTDIFRVNRCPTTKDMIVGGDCEVYVRGIDENNSETPFVYSPLGVSFGLWQDSVTGRVETVSLNNYIDGITWDQKPVGMPVEYALQPIAREKIVAVNPTSMASNEILEITPQIPIEEINQMVQPSDGADVQHYYTFRLEGGSDAANFKIPKDALSIGTPLTIRGTGLAGLDGSVGYVIDHVFTPLDTGGAVDPDHNVMLLRIYIPAIPTIASPFATPNAYVTVAEGLRPLNVNGTDLSKPFKMRSASDLTLSSPITTDANSNAAKDYQWTPASKWWEKQVPHAYLGWDSASAEAVATNKDNPAILRVDLTEAYTQAQQSGAGIGSPNPQKIPKGVRLNRIWVNFGLWGNPAQEGTVSKHTPDIFGGYQAKGGIQPHQVQAITFNLKVEIPNKDEGNPIEKGKGVLPFGGRAPTMDAINLDGLKANTESKPSKSVLDIPLYINRGAGDISPNVTDRFRSHGRDISNPDWTVGSPEHGLGIGSSTDPTHWKDLTHDSTVTDFVGNATTVGIWGGIDAYAFSSKSGIPANLPNQLVQSSTGLRDSIISVNPFGASVPPALEWDEITDMGVGAKDVARSLHKNALTGMTIVHTASLTRPNEISSPTQDTCPHAFSVALTPVADEFDSFPIDPPAGAFWDSTLGGQDFANGRKLGSTDTVLAAFGIDNRFKVGNWLRPYGYEGNALSGSVGSMLPEGARVWLEITIPNTTRTYGEAGSDVICTSNGAWVGQVLCSFEVENADGTAMSFDINKLCDEE